MRPTDEIDYIAFSVSPTALGLVCVAEQLPACTGSHCSTVHLV